MYFESTGWITKNFVSYWLVKIKNATISFEAFGGKVGLGQVKVCVCTIENRDVDLRLQSIPC